MRDEEIAEEYVQEEVCHKNCPIYGTGKCVFEIDKCHYTRQRYKTYLDGLAEGRKEKWHDLRKDPNDLPKHSGLYCVQCGEVREYVKEEKSWFTVHFEPCMNCTEETYLWCELPKFEE